MILSHNNEKKYQLNAIIIVSVIVIIALAIVQPQWVTALLFVTSLPTFIYIILKVLHPFFIKYLRKNNKPLKAASRKREAAMRNADKIGFKPFGFEKKHIVYGKNQKQAARIYNEKVKPIADANPRKKYEYVSQSYNNLND